MIYNLMSAYKDYLLLRAYRPSTAQTYYKRLCTILDGQSITNTVSQLDIKKVLDKLGTIKHKNYFSQSKNAFLHFCEFQNINLSADVLESIAELEKGTRKKYRKLSSIEYSQVDKKIKHIKNKKLKLCFQVMLATGLRVSELASITRNDCLVEDDAITLNFIGKGGKREVVALQATEHFFKLYQRLKEHIHITPPDKKVFYSAVYLMNKASELGFKCHDLRRIYAHLEYKKCGAKIKVKEKMRHTNMKNTNRYLRSKVKF